MRWTIAVLSASWHSQPLGLPIQATGSAGGLKKIVLVRDIVKPLCDNDRILTMSVYDFLLGEGGAMADIPTEAVGF